MAELIPIPPFNRNAVVSFILAVLAVLALCAGFLPVPFTMFICYPPGILLGVIALVLGFKAKRELHVDEKNGRVLALLAIWGGGFVLLAAICIVTTGVIFMPRITQFISQTLNQLRP